jgi:hypothetical protein
MADGNTGDGVVFDEASARRIIRSVLDSERRRKNNTPSPDTYLRRTPLLFQELQGTLGAYDSTNKVGTLTGTNITLPTGARWANSVEKVYNKFNLPGLGPGSTVIAVYEYHVHFDETHGWVDWTIRPYGGTDTTKTWNCVLYNNAKRFSDTSVQVKLLKADMTPYSVDSVPAYDFHGQFSSGGSETSKGVVTLVKDPETEETRLEFRDLEGPALIVCATMTDPSGVGDGTGTEVDGNATVNHYKGIGWWKADPGETIRIETCPDTVGALQPGDKVLAFLADPDTVPITYKTLEIPSNAGTNITRYAIVTKSMSASVHDGTAETFVIDPDSSLGECLLLETFWAPSMEWKLRVDLLGTGTSDIENSIVEFINPYREVPIKVGKVIVLTCDVPIHPGMTAGTNQPIPIGRYAEPYDYLEAMMFWDPGTNQILWHPANGKIQWGGATCET